VTYEFRWNDWNVEHIGRHGVTVEEAEYVVEHPERGSPTASGKKFLAWGQTAEGRYLLVIYVYSPVEVIFVIHARDLTDSEKRRLRRRGRRR
jgi:uncharacterized DUF497 family protein